MEKVIAEKVERFFTQFRKQTYKKGAVLIRADEDPTGIFYLTKGYVREYAISKKGDELVVNIFKPIAFFPMSWAINNTQNEYYFEATTDVEVYKAPKDQVLAFIKHEPEVLYDLLSRVYKGTDGMITRLTYLMAGNAYNKLITELIIHAKRFGKKSTKGIDLSITETELATQSGMARETASREIKILKDKGLVQFTKNTLTILDITTLEEELGLS